MSTYEPGTMILSSHRDIEDDETLPFPKDGFFLWFTADPPGEDIVWWHPDHASALQGVDDTEAREYFADGKCGYADITPEGSIGNLGWGIYTVRNMPPWMSKVAEDSRQVVDDEPIETAEDYQIDSQGKW